MDKYQRATLEEAEAWARNIGKRLKSELPKGWGFTLLLVSYGENGVMTYLSSCNRQDMIKGLKEITYKLENNEPNI